MTKMIKLMATVAFVAASSVTMAMADDATGDCKDKTKEGSENCKGALVLGGLGGAGAAGVVIGGLVLVGLVAGGSGNGSGSH